MPKFVFDNVTNATVNNFCIQEGYQDIVRIQDPAPGAPVGQMIDSPNPESKNAFLLRRVREYIEGVARTGKRKTREAARLQEDIADAATIVVPPGTVT